MVGYTGGRHRNPTFHDPIDHTMALYVEYNPQKVSYFELLLHWMHNDDFWEPEDDPNLRSGVFPLNDEQHERAIDFLNQLCVIR